jgi:RimJ/RimL family protein N-acetyltransferase
MVAASQTERAMNFVEFLDIHLAALEAEEVRNYMLLDILSGVVRAPSRQFRGWNFGAPGACAVQPMPDWAIVLGRLGAHHCALLAEEVEALGYPGVMGPDEGSDYFVARAVELGASFQPPIRSRIYRLGGLPGDLGVEGAPRVVTTADIGLYTRWMEAYMRSALPYDPMPESAWLQRWAADGNYTFWTVGGEPVSMAGIVCRTRTAGAITGVYTPPEHRGRGYAAAVTAAAARRILQEGKRQAILMANVENAPAIRCYARIGFEPVAPFTHYWRMRS